MKRARQTVEELDDVREIHAIVEDDVTVGFQHCQGDEQNEATRDRAPSGSNHFPDHEDVIIDVFYAVSSVKSWGMADERLTSFEIQQKPSVAEVEMREITGSMDVFVQFEIEDLKKRAHVTEVFVHAGAVRKIRQHSLHQLTKATVSEHF